MKPITLKTLPQATAQKVFNQVANHLLTQNKPSVNNIGDCVYRSPEGLKCAAGCLIADDEYDITMENKGWGYLAEEGVVTKEHMGLILTLQDLHDHSCVEDWPVKLKEVAKKYKLKWKW